MVGLFSSKEELEIDFNSEEQLSDYKLFKKNFKGSFLAYYTLSKLMVHSEDGVSGLCNENYKKYFLERDEKLTPGELEFWDGQYVCPLFKRFDKKIVSLFYTKNGKVLLLKLKSGLYLVLAPRSNVSLILEERRKE